jgi:E3 ubiquitin-protein ligases UBR4 N-terminal
VTPYFLRFFNQLFVAAEKAPGGPLEVLCASTVSRLAAVDRREVSEWLRHLLLGQQCLDSPPEEAPEGPVVGETSTEQDPDQAEKLQLLRHLAAYAARDASEALSRTVLEALIPIGSRLLSLESAGAGFSDVMQIMVALANSGSRRGHVHLFCAATLWLEQCKEFVLQPESLKKIEQVSC